MRLSDFDFELPPELIASRPVVPRDVSRLLHVLQDRLEDRQFLDLPELLRPGDLLVLNDTKVIPARLVGRRGIARFEATLHQRQGPDRWRAFVRPARRLKPGDRIDFADDFSAEVMAKGEGGEVELRFSRAGADLMAALERYGAMPLPPYIKRANGADERDRADYQTMFAKIEGAVAAPTAGLHFTPRVLEARLSRRHIATAAVTLHVGAGTFQPVKSEHTRRTPHACRRGEISADTANAIAAARARGGRVVAVGTTALRLLESAASERWLVRPFAGETDIFITPGFRFRVVDLLADQFPSAALDACSCWSRPSPGWSACAAPMRTPSAPDTASTPTAIVVCCIASHRRDEDFRFELMARDGAGTARPHRHRAWHASRRRPSCRSAPPPRSRPCCRNRVAETGAEIVLGNTYHLMLRPGAERVGGSAACTTS